jgi:hypothetical protein
MNSVPPTIASAEVRSFEGWKPVVGVEQGHPVAGAEENGVGQGLRESLSFSSDNLDVALVAQAHLFGFVVGAVVDDDDFPEDEVSRLLFHAASDGLVEIPAVVVAEDDARDARWGIHRSPPYRRPYWPRISWCSWAL